MRLFTAFLNSLRRVKTRREAAGTSMGEQEWARHRAMVDDGDRLAARGKHAEAFICYRGAIQFFREVAAAQDEATFGVGVAAVNMDLAVPLSRTAQLHLQHDRLEEAVPILEEVTACFDTAARLTGGGTRNECLQKAQGAREHAADIAGRVAKRSQAKKGLDELRTGHPAARAAAILLAQRLSAVSSRRPGAAERAFRRQMRSSLQDAFVAEMAESEQDDDHFARFVLDHGEAIARVALDLVAVYEHPESILGGDK